MVYNKRKKGEFGMGTEYVALVWELCHMLDEGKSISLQETENNWDNIIEYIKEKYGFCGVHSKGVNWSMVQEQLSNQGMSKTTAKDSGVDRNGLVYLLWVIWGIKELESLDEIIE